MATLPITYEVTRAMVEEGSVAMSYNVHGMEAHRGVDGRYYAPYGIGQALYSIPFYLIGRAIESRAGISAGKPEAVRKAVVVLGSAVAAAMAVWVAFLFAAALTGEARAAAKTALALGFATLLWPYAKFGFNAPLATLCLLAGAYGGWLAAHGGGALALVAAGAGIGGALLVRHELALGAVPIVALLWLTHPNRRIELVRRLIVFGTPVLAAAAVTLYYNYARFGNPLDAGYLRDDTIGFGSFWEGLVGLLVSPGRSLFLYSPVTLAGVVALAGLWRRNRSLAVLCGGQVLVLLAFYASLPYWDGGKSYGSRYLVPALPFLVLPLVFWFRDGSPWPEGSRCGQRRHDDRRGTAARWLLSGVLWLSFVVQVPGVLVDFSKIAYTPEVGHRITLNEQRWKWDAAGLTLNTRAALAAIPENWRYLSGAAVPPAVRPAEGRAPDFSEQFAFSLDFWWLYLFCLRAVPAPAAIGLGLASLAVAGACGWRLRRVLVVEPPAGPHLEAVDARAEAREPQADIR